MIALKMETSKSYNTNTRGEKTGGLGNESKWHSRRNVETASWTHCCHEVDPSGADPNHNQHSHLNNI